MSARRSTRKQPRLSHLDRGGRARMVDVGSKPVTARLAVAEGFVRISPALADAVRRDALGKGPVLEVARLAGILAAKRTDELIPLCHPLPIDGVEVSAALERSGRGPNRVRIEATVRTRARTGVEMEALAAVAVACLAVIDMGKSIDRAMVIESVRLLEKRGGRRGPYLAPDLAAGKPRSRRGATR